jgi:hypothetical protein
VIVFENLWWLSSREGRQRPREWLTAQLLVALAFLPWVGLVLVQFESGSGNWLHLPPIDAPVKTLFRFVAGYGVDVAVPRYRYAAVVPFLGLYVPLLLVGVLGGEGEIRPWRAALLGYLFVPLVIALAVSRLVKPLYIIGRYDLLVFPAFALLVGRGLAWLGGGWRSAAMTAMACSTSIYLGLYWLGPPVK